MNQTIIIPALCPDHRVVSLVRELTQRGANRILVVDDGSGPLYAPVFSALEQEGCKVVHHRVNHGKGAALRTGITFAREYWPTTRAVVSADADGQHTAEDILRVAYASDLHPNAYVLGCRDFSLAGIPARSRVGNRIMAAIFRFGTGVDLSDTQTGLRALPARFFDEALACPGNRFEWEMDLLFRLAREGHEVASVPISTVYLNGNASSHFHPLRDSIRIMAPVARYALASLFAPKGASPLATPMQPEALLCP